MRLWEPYSDDEFIDHEEEYYAAGEALMAKRGVRSDFTMTQLCLYAEIAYLRGFIDGLLDALAEGER